MKKWPNFPELEKKILEFWEENKIFKKSLEQRKSAPAFVFYEGPPFANGRPGVHHVLARAFKDLIARYKTMQGFYVARIAGWDTHGLPTEIEAEKKLGLKSKKEIEKVGIKHFIDECRASVFLYKAEWEKMTRVMAYWIDLEAAYITCSNDYIESEFWILKQVWKKGQLFQDYKVIPYCPRCGTTLSFHEVAQGYKNIREESIYIKLKVKDSRFKNTYLLVWTTTPWTLPGNVAVAANPSLNYVLVKKEKEFLILAKGRLKVLDGDFKVVKEFKGEDLLGLKYEPLFDFIKPDKKAYFVVAGDFVTVEEGTGLVHIAPAFGQDDMAVARKNDLEVLMTVDLEGKFIREITPWAGKFVKDADPKITNDLRTRGLLFKIEMYTHDYPFCWRCDTPLLYYAKLTWFIKMGLLKKNLIKENEKINWTPAYIKEGRFGQWLQDVRDWAISRERYWGTPLPIWQCRKCNNIKVVGSIKELEKTSGEKINDLHRPYIDKITFKCEKCGGQMKRVPEVLDCWFDSGSMPFAQWHWPFENKKKIDEGESFPADFICEAIDQTRGWFYTLLAISVLLEKGTPYKNVICLGHVLDDRGEKMSKSKGNVVEPEQAIGKYGADALRWYFYTINQPGDSKRFDFNGIKEVFARHLLTLWNTYCFLRINTDEGRINTDTQIRESVKISQKSVLISSNILDKWIVSELQMLIKSVTLKLDKYDVTGAIRDIETFIDDLSNWYVRRSRKRFREGHDKKDREKAFQTLYMVLVELVKLLAPFTPFITEEVYRNLTNEVSVHLSDWPRANQKLIDKKLNEKMALVRQIVGLGLATRAKAGIKVRQPLKRFRVQDSVGAWRAKPLLVDLIKDELNVKEVKFVRKVKEAKGWEALSDGKITVALDTKITDDLKEEGLAREIVRQIQELRKAAGYKFSDKVFVYFKCRGLARQAPTIAKILDKCKTYIEKETISKLKKGGRDIKVDKEEEIELAGVKIWLGVHPVRLFRKKSNGVKK